MLAISQRDRAKLIDPLFRTGVSFWITLIILLGFVIWGGWMYIGQLRHGLVVTGLNRPVYWGVYMVNLFFFIGISQAGTIVSTTLRLTGAEWRRPITRVAEAITAFAIIVAALQIIIDMGRPDRLLLSFPYGRLQSPILWDIISLTVYLIAAAAYLYLPLIPDLAIIRDNCPEHAAAWQRRFYSILSLGWRGNREQWRRLQKAIAIMAIFIAPVAVSVNTIEAWILATTVQPGWHSSIFGPYFVVGALFSGIGAIILALTIVRKRFSLEDYITEKQFNNLGLAFIGMVLIWAYFTYNESLGIIATQQLDEFPVLVSKLWGQHSLSFWLMLVLHGAAFWILVVPRLMPSSARELTLFRPVFPILASLAALTSAILLLWPEFILDQLAPAIELLLWITLVIGIIYGGLGWSIWLKSRMVTATVIAAIFVIIGMWQERWLIVVPTMTHPRMIPFTVYVPTMTEIAITIGSAALLGLMFFLFFRLFPVISIWEHAEGRVIAEAKARVQIPVPEPSQAPAD